MIPLGKGILLVAAPALKDPNFRQAVVLLCEHGPEGALGVIVNRPTGMSISEALPQVPILEGQPHVLYAGGPVQTNQVMMLYRINQTPDNSHQVIDGVCLGGDLEIMERILMQQPEKESFRAYLGYSGWGPGQLESEMQTALGSPCRPIRRLSSKKIPPIFGLISSCPWTMSRGIMRICRSILPATRQIHLSSALCV